MTSTYLLIFQLFVCTGELYSRYLPVDPALINKIYSGVLVPLLRVQDYS